MNTYDKVRESNTADVTCNERKIDHWKRVRSRVTFSRMCESLVSGKIALWMSRERRDFSVNDTEIFGHLQGENVSFDSCYVFVTII